jgi:glycosyltransferase 2 family protein
MQSLTVDEVHQLKHWRIGLLGVVVSLLAIYLIVSQVDLNRLGVALRTARYEYVLPAALLLVAGLATRAARWRVLLSGALPLGRAFSITNVSYLVNGLLPLRIGEVARAVLANRVTPPVPVLKSASSIIVERMLDLLAVLVLLGFALASGPALPQEYRSAALVTIPLLLAGFGVLIVLASQRRRVEVALGALVEWVPALQKLNVAAWSSHFLDGLLPLTQPGLLLRALLWTGASWGLSLAAGYILMFAFYDQADWATTALYIAAAAFVIAVPAVPGNIGTYEWAIMLALAAMGLGEPTDPVNVSFAVVVHALNLAVYAVMGTLGFVQEGISLGQLTAEAEKLDYKTAS